MTITSKTIASRQNPRHDNKERRMPHRARWVKALGSPRNDNKERCMPHEHRNVAPTTTNLPAFFVPIIEEQYGSAYARLIEQGSDVRRATTLRANTLLSTREEVASILDDAGIEYECPAWYQDAFVLDPKDAQAVWELPALEEGKIYLQSLSSMLPPLLMGPCSDLDILDMCAAPGGKTTQLAALNNGRARITACEMNAPRAERLEYNLKRQGTRNVVVMRTDARRLDSFFSFDRIMLDAPCSGSGTLRASSAKTLKHFTPALIQKCTKSQSALLPKALELLKPGGTMVYSTCSILKEENEEMVRSSLKKASKHGAYELVPISLPGATLVPATDMNLATTTDTTITPATDTTITPARKATLASATNIDASPNVLPVLPTTLEGTLTLCPTKLFEGFFCAKIKRLA